LASGPALERRFGAPETWPGNQAVVDLASHYLAQGLAILVYTVAPERIVIGGGVAALPGLHDRIRVDLARLLSGYPGDPDLDLLVAKPGLGDLSGLAGGLVLAQTGGR
jgi:fructokinase